MAYTEVRDTAFTIDASGNRCVKEKREYLIESASDVSSLPECLPGSVAYTPDLTYMAMYDGEEWHQIGGGS